MVIIIEPNRHTEFEDLICKFHERLFVRYGTYTTPIDIKAATYFIALSERKKYLGGAFLIKRESQTILKRTRLLSKHLKNCTVLWEFGGIHIDCERGQNYLSLASVFYSNLYRQLEDFCTKRGIPYVCVHITYIEKSSINQYGHWPMVGHIADSWDGNMCYGFMRLDGKGLPVMDFSL